MSSIPDMSVGHATTVSFALTEAEVSDLETLALYRATTLRLILKEALIRYRVDMGEEILRAHAQQMLRRAWLG